VLVWKCMLSEELGWKTYSTTPQRKQARQLTIHLPKTPRPYSSLRLLIILLILFILLKQILIPHIQKRLQLAHHPRQTNIRNLLIVIPTPDIRMRARKPHLSQRRPIPLGFLPHGGRKRRPQFVEREGLERVLDAVAELGVVEGGGFRFAHLQADALQEADAWDAE
jgi:hypothetical protein